MKPSTDLGTVELGLVRLTRSGLVQSGLAVAMVTAVILAATPGSAYTGCVLSRLAGPQPTATGDGPSDLLSATPDSQARAAALGSLGAIAALATGGLMVRRRRLAQVATPASDADLAAELVTETELVLVANPDEIETEVALAYRR